jgi:hypothetical protein
MEVDCAQILAITNATTSQRSETRRPAVCCL